MKTTNQHNFRGGETDLLVVEDNPADIRLIEEVVSDSSLEVTVHDVSTSDAGLDFIYQGGRYADVPKPDLVFLDWNLEQTTGREILTTLKTEYTHIPVVVLTGSKAPLEIDQSPAAQADLLTEKPSDPDEYIQILRSTAPDQ
ncbi:response regulator [Streptomyces sanglieri]